MVCELRRKHARKNILLNDFEVNINACTISCYVLLCSFGLFKYNRESIGVYYECLNFLYNGFLLFTFIFTFTGRNLQYVHFSYFILFFTIFLLNYSMILNSPGAS